MLSDRPRVIAYLATAGLIALATLFKAGVDYLLGVTSGFAFYMVAIAIVAWAFGRGPGWFAVFLGGAAMAFYFYEPKYLLQRPSRVQEIQLIVLMLAAGAIVEVLRFAVTSRHQVRLYSKETQRLSALATQTQSRMQHALGSLTEPFAILTAVRDQANRIVDFRVDYMNEVGQQSAEQQGASHVEQIGSLLTETSPLVKPLGVFDAYVKTVDTGEPYHAEVQVDLAAPVGNRWIEIHASKLDDGIVVQWRDTTERHKSEEAIAKNETRYRSLVQATSAIVWRADSAGQFTDHQPLWSEFTGQTITQYAGFGWMAAIHPEDREQFRKRFDRSIANRSKLEYSLRLARYDGEYRSMLVRAVPMLDGDGDSTEWIGTYTDITERVQAEEALRRSENRFRRLYESNQIGVVCYDESGSLTDPNRAFLAMLGMSREQYDAEGLDWRKITPPGWEEVDRANWDQLRQHGACGPFEKQYLRRDGTLIDVLITASNLEAGISDHGVACVVDLSQIKQVEASLRQSQKDLIALTESLEQRVIERTAEADHRSQQLRALALDLAETESRERKRLARLLHDHFQQLISAAKLKAGLVRRGTTEQKMIDGLRQVEGLLEEAIAASRSLATELSPPVLSDGGLIAALEWVARKMAKDYGLQITLSCEAASEPESEQVRTMVFECVRELLFNIVKHADTKEASLTAKLTPEGLLQIIIEDKGKGFDVHAAMRKSMTAGQDGSFGLFSIRERLSLIGGLLNIRSVPEHGTRVDMTVAVGLKKLQPVVDAKSNGALPGDLAAAVVNASRSNGTLSLYDASNPARVLVADDHRLFREGLINLLSQEPMLKIVGEAADGQEAVDLCEKLNPDILICDVTMPKLNGVQVTKHVSRTHPSTRIIGLSMHEREDMADAMRNAGAVAYVTKSGPSDQLLSVIRQVTLNQPLESI